MKNHNISTPKVKKDILLMSFDTTICNPFPRLIVSIKHFFASKKSFDQLYMIIKTSLKKHLTHPKFNGIDARDSGACCSVGIDFDMHDPDIFIIILDVARFLSNFDEYLSKLIETTKRMILGINFKGFAA